jgi:hypothetical protein
MHTLGLRVISLKVAGRGANPIIAILTSLLLFQGEGLVPGLEEPNIESRDSSRAGVSGGRTSRDTKKKECPGGSSGPGVVPATAGPGKVNEDDVLRWKMEKKKRGKQPINWARFWYHT